MTEAWFFKNKISKSFVGDPEPDPHVSGPPDPDPLVRSMDPDPDPSLSYEGVQQTEIMLAK